MLPVGGGFGHVVNKLATVVVVLAALVGIGVGLVLSRLTEVRCPRAFGNCFEVHRFSNVESAGIGLLAAVVVGVGLTVVAGRLSHRNGLFA